MVTIAVLREQAIAFLEHGNIPTALDQTVGTPPGYLSDSSYLGRALHTLIGSIGQPTAIHLLAYTTMLPIIATLMKVFAASAARRRRQCSS
ncbi:MAG TPA: hypothetical protein VMF12_08365 [Xanthobacteraceae bacterium]|nr:hypothetical protein [Xanthobacteraceae bacterium]